MAGLCESGSESTGSIKAIYKIQPDNQSKRDANSRLSGTSEYELSSLTTYANFLIVDGVNVLTLNEALPGRWVGRGSPTLPAPLAWPPRSPDLTIYDNSLWELIKGWNWNGIKWNLTEGGARMGGGTDGPALRPIEIYCANPRYGMSCVPQIPYAHRPNHITPLTTGPYSRQNPYIIPASANSPKAPLSVRGETPPSSRYASIAIAEAIQRRLTTFHEDWSRESAASGGRR
ncbi:hypothetical protein ANN_04453 [Periplaneta americana]|uniref:Uncharacterized protein n=1 Tax=Periplaneta americana TaxID=6978 RepID=A0ABQ8TB02_PERAM|nr:hypothetical protein ANN_04453 [Periplaneta americana]